MVTTMLKLTEAEEKEKRKRANDEINKMDDFGDESDYESENDEYDSEGSNSDGNAGD